MKFTPCIYVTYENNGHEFKIGYTRRTPEIRAEEYGADVDWTRSFYMTTSPHIDIATLEERIHGYMRRHATRSRMKWRQDGDTEWYERRFETALLAYLYIGRSRLGIASFAFYDSDTAAEHDILVDELSRVHIDMNGWDGTASMAHTMTEQAVMDLISTPLPTIN